MSTQATLQEKYQQAIRFAAEKHGAMNQVVPGTELPYLMHLSNVAMEIMVASTYTTGFRLEFAIQVALLHDTIEDTETTYDELAAAFSNDIANAVSALTKRKELPKADKMSDSLNRIKLLPTEVWAVKLADRITNLQPPPAHWDVAKRKRYHAESKEILAALKGANDYLEKRLEEKIREYEVYCR